MRIDYFAFCLVLISSLLIPFKLALLGGNDIFCLLLLRLCWLLRLNNSLFSRRDDPLFDRLGEEGKAASSVTLCIAIG
jgi:hypothetical protein